MLLPESENITAFNVPYPEQALPEELNINGLSNLDVILTPNYRGAYAPLYLT